MSQMKSIPLCGQESDIGLSQRIRIVSFWEKHGEYLEYTVPTDINEGDYRIVLQDAEGNEYGADMVKVTKSSLIISGASRATANTDWTISGINLNNIVSLTIGGQTVSQFSNQSDNVTLLI